MQQVTTLVEFFSDNTINNVLGAFAFKPRRLLFLIDQGLHEQEIQATRQALHRRLPQIETGFYQVNNDQPDSIRRGLEELYGDHPDCVLDFTGGSELMLLAAYSFGFQNNVPMLHISMESRSLINVHRCEALAGQFAFPQLALEDHLNMNGAFLAGCGHEPLGEPWDEPLRAFCDLVLEDQHKWKEQCLFLQMAAARTKDLTVESPLLLHTADQNPVSGDRAYLRRLADTGMLLDLELEQDRLAFRFPNERVRHCLCTSGMWLEMYTYLLLRDSGRFNDVRLSVRIGWGQQGTQNTAYNEIDIIACAGITPLFISCKSGLPNPDSMNEILVYARKFGGAGAKVAMVTSSEISRGFVGLRKRAADLGTVIVDRSDIREGLARGMLLYMLDAKA